jgi:release factor glutamine methyltransferase
MDLFKARAKLERIADDAGIINGVQKAQFIFEHFTGLTKEDLYHFGHEYQLEGWKFAQMARAVNRLIKGTPVQLIIGYTHFYDHTFLCRKGVLIPRPETEALVDAAIAEIDSRNVPLRILDLFCGSGIIAISLAKARPQHQYFAGDLSRKAVNLAKANSSRLDAPVQWRVGDMFAPFADRYDGFDIITANPPYVPTSEIKRLPADVRLGDPREALDGGRDGLKFHRLLARDAAEWFKPGGCLIVEMGFDQRKAVRQLFKPAKLKFMKDLWRKDRIYIARY